MPENYSENKNLDYKETKRFWEKRAERVRLTGNLFEANLSDNIPLQAIFKDAIEKQIIEKSAPLMPDYEILDLGCGSGRMSLFFARACKRVVAVDFSLALLERARGNAMKCGLNNITFIEENINSFYCKEKFDLIFLGGVLSYLNDADAKNMLGRAKEMLKPEGRLLIRDSLSFRKSCVIREKYNKNFEDNYSVIYRSIKEFKSALKESGFAFDLETSLAIFPFMGLYHLVIKKIFGSGAIFAKLSKNYFGLVSYFSPFILFYRNSGIYEFFAYLLNKYDQRFFICSLK